MRLIEVCGMPRSGKTTALKKLGEKSNTIIHHERFDLNPCEYKDVGKFNMWYATYCAKKVNEIRAEADGSHTHILDRGILDRIAFGKALAKSFIYNEAELRKYLSILEPLTTHNSITIVFDINPHKSIERITNNIHNITHELCFLTCLYEE